MRFLHWFRRKQHREQQKSVTHSSELGNATYSSTTPVTPNHIRKYPVPVQSRVRQYRHEPEPTPQPTQTIVIDNSPSVFDQLMVAEMVSTAVSEDRNDTPSDDTGFSGFGVGQSGGAGAGGDWSSNTDSPSTDNSSYDFSSSDTSPSFDLGS